MKPLQDTDWIQRTKWSWVTSEACLCSIKSKDRQTNPSSSSQPSHPCSFLLPFPRPSVKSQMFKHKPGEKNARAGWKPCPTCSRSNTENHSGHLSFFPHGCCCWISISFQLLQRQEEAPALWCFKGEFSCSMLMKTKSIAIKNHLVRFNYRI